LGANIAVPVVPGSDYLATDMGALIIPSGGIINFKGVASTPTYVN
jgi:hypothetical protein